MGKILMVGRNVVAFALQRLITATASAGVPSYSPKSKRADGARVTNMEQRAPGTASLTTNMVSWAHRSLVECTLTLSAGHSPSRIAPRVKRPEVLPRIVCDTVSRGKSSVPSHPARASRTCLFEGNKQCPSRTLWRPREHSALQGRSVLRLLGVKKREGR